MKYEAIIFDWDGTLADSTARIVESMQLAAKDAGVAQRTDFDIQQIIGLGLKEAIQTLWPENAHQDDVIEQIRMGYNHHFIAEIRPVVELYDFAHEMLEKLNVAGHQLGVATGKSRSGLNRAFRELGVGHLFHGSRCADETRSKPHPLMLNELMEVLSVAPEEVLMVGDTQFDIDMATAAGVDSVAITHGAHSIDRLKRSRPNHVVSDLRELSRWLKVSV